MRLNLLLILLIVFTSACNSDIGLQPGKETLQPPAQPGITATITLTSTLTPISPTPTPELINEVCSPLADEGLAELPEIITQAFKMPRPGNDDGHQGVDFAYYRRKDRNGIEGLDVKAALSGIVVTILNDRWPYGHAVIIETPIEKINPVILKNLTRSQIEPTIVPDPRVNCPPGELIFGMDQSSRSLYILYGHLKDLAILSIGDTVECGQSIGTVGNSGYSTNPHLHFETRIGPSGARFDSMAYYTAASSQAERYNYCVWRVSNLFQLFDPMELLSIQE